MGKLKERMFERYLYDADVLAKDYLDTSKMERVTKVWDRKTWKEVDMDEDTKVELVRDLMENGSGTTEEEIDKMLGEFKGLKKKQ